MADSFLTTPSYGILFLDAILQAADLSEIGGSQIDGYQTENLQDMTFNIRDQTQGLNLDFMTYSMYTLANKDPEALLDLATFKILAEKTFSTFFQHYVSSNVSMDSGSWAYQTINASLPADLGPGIDIHTGNGSESQEPLQFPSNTSRTATVQVSRRVELLQMNAAAVWLSVAILIWLIATTVIIAAAQRRYSRSLIRNVECVADVLVLIAGSENLLRVVQEKGFEGLKRDGDQLMTRLGWFEGSDGEVRWGVEVVGRDYSDRSGGYVDGVTWVSGPNQGRRQGDGCPKKTLGPCQESAPERVEVLSSQNAVSKTSTVEDAISRLI